MILKPFDPIQEALEVAGIAKPVLATNREKNLAQFQETLNYHGASVEDAARAIGGVLKSGEPNETLRAANLVLQAHGVLKEAEKPSIPAITINIHGKESRNLLQLVTPNMHHSEMGVEA